MRPAPLYPENPGGHGCVSSAVAEILEELVGRGRLDLEIRSDVTDATRHYDDADAWLDDVVDARIRLAIHVRDGMDDAREIGCGVTGAVADSESGSAHR
ncbi:hypothetical protein [Geodermatophilus sp. DSM 45219]|uniref:hypothetical protein n=1 Tax=Geodermatophilus sp. DSM 45219 TaxID=1881103 RepID=UPI0008825C52|nr:hypothetical protein [Geodermatophilus sp. DSM 45219]SDN74446.1 hypothetical protein SAMN05428965_1417 [Geodermatophilus sp. DSM 45219]